MSDKKWILALEILAGNSSLLRVLNTSQTGVKNLVNHVKADFQSIRSAWSSTAGKLATLGMGVGAVKLISDSARLDHALTKIAQSAGRTSKDAAALKVDLVSLGIATGESTENLEAAFRTLVSFNGWDAARASISAVNNALTVTDANAETVGMALASASKEFHIDLKQPRAAADLLDKMTKMGEGAGGLQHAAEMFSQISMRASMAGMSADSALQFIGMIGKVGGTPEQIDLVAASTLRMFTNIRELARIRGVKIFDETGKQRDPVQILKDVNKEFKTLNNKGQMRELMRIFHGDRMASQGVLPIFESGALDQLDDIIDKEQTASGTIAKEVPDAIKDAHAQAERLKNSLVQAAQGFARPINKAMADLIQHAIGSKESGGLGLSGGQVAGIGIGTLVAGALAKAEIGSLLSKLFKGKVGGLGVLGGVAEGKIMQNTMGVTPVFVVNASDIGGGLGLVGGAGKSGFSGLLNQFGRPIGILGGVEGAVAAEGATAGVAAAGGVAAIAAIVWPLAIAAGGLGLIALLQNIMKSENDKLLDKEAEQNANNAREIYGWLNPDGKPHRGSNLHSVSVPPPHARYRESTTGEEDYPRPKEAINFNSGGYHKTEVTVFIDTKKTEPKKVISRGTFYGSSGAPSVSINN